MKCPKCNGVLDKFAGYTYDLYNCRGCDYHSRIAEQVADAWQARAERAEAEVSRLTERTYCAYCGFEIVIADQAEARRMVDEHIAACPQHPMAALRERIADLERQLAEAQRERDEYRQAAELVAKSAGGECSTLKQERDEARAALAERDAALGEIMKLDEEFPDRTAWASAMIEEAIDIAHQALKPARGEREGK